MGMVWRKTWHDPAETCEPTSLPFRKSEQNRPTTVDLASVAATEPGSTVVGRFCSDFVNGSDVESAGFCEIPDVSLFQNGLKASPSERNHLRYLLHLLAAHGGNLGMTEH